VKVRKMLIVLFLTCLNSAVYSQTAFGDFQCELYQTYIDDQMDKWPGLIGQLEALDDSSAQAQKEILLARYGLIGFYLGNERKQEARDELSLAFDQLERVKARFPDDAAFYSMDACLHAYQIALSMVQAPIYYARHQAAIRKAEELNKSEPLLSFAKANMLFYKPRLLGGNKEEAILLYQETLELAGKQRYSECSWFKMMVELFLLKAYYETDNEKAFESLLADLRESHGELSWVNKFLNSRVVE